MGGEGRDSICNESVGSGSDVCKLTTVTVMGSAECRKRAHALRVDVLKLRNLAAVSVREGTWGAHRGATLCHSTRNAFAEWVVEIVGRILCVFTCRMEW